MEFKIITENFVFANGSEGTITYMMHPMFDMDTPDLNAIEGIKLEYFSNTFNDNINIEISDLKDESTI